MDGELAPAAAPPSETADSMPWGKVCSIIQRLRDGKVKAADRKAIIFPDELLNAARFRGESLYPYVRLLVPAADSRGRAGLGVPTVAEIYGQLYALPAATVEALRHYNKPTAGSRGKRWGNKGSKDVGDFIANLYNELRAREGSRPRAKPEEGKTFWTVADVNAFIDEVINSQHTTQARVALFAKALPYCNAFEQVYLVSALLGDHKVKASVDTLLKMYHPDAADLYNATHSLAGIFSNPVLRDPTRRMTAQITLGVPFTPMRGVRAAFETTVVDAGTGAGATGSKGARSGRVEPLKNWDNFFIERKLDGERSLVHLMKGEGGAPQLLIFSRRAYSRPDFEEAVGPDLIAALANAEEAILDGEMVAWDAVQGSILGFGENRKIAEAMRACRAAGQDVKSLPVRLCFVAFDILHYKPKPSVARALELGQVFNTRDGVAPTREPRDPFYQRKFECLDSSMQLSERRRLLEAVLNTTVGECVLVDSVRVDMPTLEERKRKLLEAFEAAIERGDEGLMVKQADSFYIIKDSAVTSKWLKVKPEYSIGAFQTLDLVIVGGYYPEGFRAGLRGRVCRFLLAVAQEGSMKEGCPPRPSSKPAVHLHSAGGDDAEGGGRAGGGAGSDLLSPLEDGTPSLTPGNEGAYLGAGAAYAGVGGGAGDEGAGGGGFPAAGAAFLSGEGATGIRPLPRVWIPVCKVGSGYTVDDITTLESYLRPHELRVVNKDKRAGAGNGGRPPPAATAPRSTGWLSSSATTSGIPRMPLTAEGATMQASLQPGGGGLYSQVEAGTQQAAGGGRSGGARPTAAAGEIAWSSIDWLPNMASLPSVDIPDVVYPPWKSVVVEVKGSELLSNAKWPLNMVVRFPRVEALRFDKPVNDILTDGEINELRRSNGGRLALRATHYADADAARRGRKAVGGSAGGRTRAVSGAAPGHEWPSPTQLAACPVASDYLGGCSVVVLPGFYEGAEGRVGVALAVKRLGGVPLFCLPPRDRKGEVAAEKAARADERARKKAEREAKKRGGDAPPAAGGPPAPPAAPPAAPPRAHLVIAAARGPLASAAAQEGYIVYRPQILQEVEQGRGLPAEPDTDLMLVAPSEVIESLRSAVSRYSGDHHTKPTTAAKLTEHLRSMRLREEDGASAGGGAGSLATVTTLLQRLDDPRDVGALLFNAGNTVASVISDEEVAEEVVSALRRNVFRDGGRATLQGGVEAPADDTGRAHKRARLQGIEEEHEEGEAEGEQGEPHWAAEAGAALMAGPVDPSVLQDRYRLFEDAEGAWEGYGLGQTTAAPIVGGSAGNGNEAAASAGVDPLFLGSSPVPAAAASSSSWGYSDWQAGAQLSPASSAGHGGNKVASASGLGPAVPATAAVRRVPWRTLGATALLGGVLAYFDLEGDAVAQLQRAAAGAVAPAPVPASASVPPLDVDPTLAVVRSDFRAHKGRVVTAKQGAAALPDVIIVREGWGQHRWAALQHAWGSLAALGGRGTADAAGGSGAGSRLSGGKRPRDAEAVTPPPVVEARWVNACIEAGVLLPLEAFMVKLG